MRFYTRQHRHCCGVDLYVKTMPVCILDSAGQVQLHRNLPAAPDALLAAVARYRDDLMVGAECMFTWYWLADLCAADGIPFVLGHALAMKAHSWGHGQERHDRRPQDRHPPPRRTLAGGLRLPGGHARHARPATAGACLWCESGDSFG
jgi:hypothetical protein